MSFFTWADFDSREIVPGYHGKFVHGENMTATHWQVEAGAVLPEHAHPHEQISVVLEGTFELTINGEARQLTPGDVAVIPGHAPHSGRAITACRLMDVFSPPRDEYR